MRQVGGMRRLRGLRRLGLGDKWDEWDWWDEWEEWEGWEGWEWWVDRLGLDCKNVEKVRKLADKIPEKYNKVENTIFDNISPEGIEYNKWKNSLEFIPNITHTETKTEF